MLKGQRLRLAASHCFGQRQESLLRFARNRLRRVVGAGAVGAAGGGDQLDAGGSAGAREGGVGSLAGELLGAADDDGGFDGRALAGVAGDGVGVLQVAGHVVRLQGPLGVVGDAQDDLVVRCDGGIVPVVPLSTSRRWLLRRVIRTCRKTTR